MAFAEAVEERDRWNVIAVCCPLSMRLIPEGNGRGSTSAAGDATALLFNGRQGNISDVHIATPLSLAMCMLSDVFQICFR